MNETSPPVRVRIAPSPTGDPHVGTAYAAMFNLAFARRHGGSFILRIEDTDRTRFAAGSEEQIFSTLRWLGFEWDEGPDVGGPYAPYRQSERLPRYAEVAAQLIESGHAYHCWCSPERLSQMRLAQQAAKRPTGYDRLCLGKTRDERAALEGFSEPPVVRMLAPDGVPPFDDLIRGAMKCPQPDDQVLMKADGFPTYHLAVVVDDHDMGITTVVRGEEWVSSTAKHILLYQWLGWAEPRFAHFPLLRNTDRSKISKRKNPAARLKWFQEEGYLPAALLNFLALLGYSLPDLREVFTFDEMVESFDWSRVNPVGPVFDIDKLDWLNGHYIRALDDDEFLAVAAPFLPAGITGDQLRWITGALKERTKRLAELPEQLEFLMVDVASDAAALTKKGLTPEEGAPVLAEVASALEKVSPFEPAPIEVALNEICAAHELKRGKMFMTVRVAVAGGPVSPPLHETLAALGAERSAARLRAAAATLESARSATVE